MSKWDGKFNGTYDTSKYAERPLVKDILAAEEGAFAYKGPNRDLI